MSAPPLQPEFALGAVTEEGEIVLGLGAMELGITKEEIKDSALNTAKILRQKRWKLADGRPPLDPKSRIVILIDDGIATGATISVAAQSLKSKLFFNEESWLTHNLSKL